MRETIKTFIYMYASALEAPLIWWLEVIHSNHFVGKGTPLKFIKTDVNRLYYKLIAIFRRQYHIILTASWEKIYSVLGGVASRHRPVRRLKIAIRFVSRSNYSSFWKQTGNAPNFWLINIRTLSTCKELYTNTKHAIRFSASQRIMWILTYKP